METFDKITRLLSDRRGIDPQIIKPETKFCDLELDSLDMTDLILYMEEDFSVSIELKEELRTVGSVADYIDMKLCGGAV